MEDLEYNLKSIEMNDEPPCSTHEKNKYNLMASLNLVKSDQEPVQNSSNIFGRFTKKLLKKENNKDFKMEANETSEINVSHKSCWVRMKKTRRVNKRLELTGVALLEWRQREAQRVRNRRARYTPEQRAAWRKRSAQRARDRRKRFTEEELQLWRSRNAAYSRTRRAKMSEEQLQARRAKSREKAQQRRANLTPEQKDRERIKQIERKLKRRMRMSSEEYMKYLELETKKRKERRQRGTELRPTKVCKIKKKKVSGDNEHSHLSTKALRINSCICLICNEHVPCRKLLRRHILKQHQLQIPFPCGLCWRSFPKRNDLARHRILIHQQQDKYSCGICGKESMYYTTIMNHGRTHLNQGSIFQIVPQDDQEIYICKSCKIIFVKKEMYNAHNKWDHMGVVITNTENNCSDVKNEKKGKMCEHCGKMFRIKSKLNIHFMIEHPDKETNSEITESDEKSTSSYTCKFCGKIFIHQIILNNHLAKYHPDFEKNWEPKIQFFPENYSENSACKIENHSCLFCELTFERESKLKNHFLIDHPELSSGQTNMASLMFGCKTKFEEVTM